MGIPADKLGHAFIFSILVFFMMLGAFQYKRVSFPLLKTSVISGGIALAYAILIELVQHYAIPGRVGDVMDVVADVMGVVIGWFIFYMFRGQLK
jgi:VanZ family protein